MDRPPQDRSDVPGTVIAMAQVSVALLVHFSSNWQGYFSHPLGVSIRHTLLPLTGNLGMLRNEVSKDKTLFSSRAAPSSQGFGIFSF